MRMFRSEKCSDVMKERGLRSSCSVPSAHARGAHVVTTKEAPCERILRGSAVCRYGSASSPLGVGADERETVRILNDRDVLAEVMSRAGESPEVVLEATYGWVRSEGA